MSAIDSMDGKTQEIFVAESGDNSKLYQEEMRLSGLNASGITYANNEATLVQLVTRKYILRVAGVGKDPPDGESTEDRARELIERVGRGEYVIQELFTKVMVDRFLSVDSVPILAFPLYFYPSEWGNLLTNNLVKVVPINGKGIHEDPIIVTRYPSGRLNVGETILNSRESIKRNKPWR